MKKKHLFFLLLLLLLSQDIDTRSHGGGGSHGRGSSHSRGSSSSHRSKSRSFSSSSGSKSYSSSISGSRGSLSSRTSSSSLSSPKVQPGRSSSGIIGNNSPTYPYYQPQSIYNPIRPSSGPTNFFSNLASTAIGSAVGNGIGSYIGNSIFRHNNRNYYYGRENYQQEEVDEFMCSMPIEHLRIYTNGSCYDVNTKENYQLIDYDQILNSENETSTKEITWGCKIINEICCCTECCTLEKIKN